MKKNEKKINKIKLKFSKLSPGGNITILVWTNIDRKMYSSIAKKLLVENKDAEQVGFVEESKNKKAIAHLQMMGGEFCGNATRSLAYELVRNKNPKINIKGNIAKFYLTVSGTDRLLEVVVNLDKDNKPVWVKVEMPVYSDLRYIDEQDDKAIVELEGITHIVINEGERKLKFSNLTYKKDFLKIINSVDLTDIKEENKLAIGVIWKRENKDKIIFIDPVVWVKNTNTYYYETACASGTLAVALAEVIKNLDENIISREYQIYQPSGEKIVSKIKKNNQKIFSASIEGSVNFLLEDNNYLLKN